MDPCPVYPGRDLLRCSQRRVLAAQSLQLTLPASCRMIKYRVERIYVKEMIE